MRVVSAYLLALLGGNESPGAKDIEKILGSVGIEAESKNIEKLLAELKGKDILDILARGREKLAAVPAGGAVVASGGGAAAAPGGGGGGAAAAAEEKEEEKEASESDEDMGMSLFD